MRVYAVILLIGLFIFSGCSNKNKEFDKPATYWYKKMIEAIKAQDMEVADDMFISLQSEHINSPLLPEAMLILARGHMEQKEYQLANFYLDEYIKRFGGKDNMDFAKALKIKSNFLAFKLTNRDQKLLLESIKEAEQFIKDHPYSEHRPIVDTMLVKMLLANKEFDNEIARLYEKIDKPKAAEFYKNKTQYEWLKDLSANPVKESWYREIFNW